MSTYKIGVLQQALDESVLAAELEAANKQYNELTAKYRDIIQRENSLVARSATVDNLEVGFFENKFTMLLCWFFFYHNFNGSFEVILYGCHNHIQPYRVIVPTIVGVIVVVNAHNRFFFYLFLQVSLLFLGEIAYSLRDNLFFLGRLKSLARGRSRA